MLSLFVFWYVCAASISPSARPLDHHRLQYIAYFVLFGYLMHWVAKDFDKQCKGDKCSKAASMQALTSQGHLGKA